MAMLLSTGDIHAFSGAFIDHFDTFSDKRDIVVYKEPKKTVIQSADLPMAGYGASSNPENYQLTPVSGVFPAIIRYKRLQKQFPLPDLQTSINKGTVTIKVQEHARNFINEGKTECIQFDNKSWNVIGTDAVQNYLGVKYYYYDLEVAN
jgi:hypothetical protein